MCVFALKVARGSLATVVDVCCGCRAKKPKFGRLTDFVATNSKEKFAVTNLKRKSVGRELYEVARGRAHP